VSTIESARGLALRLDQAVHRAAGEIVYDSVNSFFINLRAYLQVQDDTLGANNNLFAILRRIDDQSGLFLTNLGPAIDAGDTANHFHFPSGARLSFGVTLRRGHQCALVSYRFHYVHPGPEARFFRFDLNPQPHEDPLSEPRCHLHPGFDQVRLPIPALSPVEVLDRIFFVLDEGPRR